MTYYIYRANFIVPVYSVRFFIYRIVSSFFNWFFACKMYYYVGEKKKAIHLSTKELLNDVRDLEGSSKFSSMKGKRRRSQEYWQKVFWSRNDCPWQSDDEGVSGI